MPHLKSRPSSIFFKPKSKALAEKISITSPAAFNRSIMELKKGGVTLRERRALTLARTRAKAQLGRKNLSLSERKQFRTISRTKIPKVTRR